MTYLYFDGKTIHPQTHQQTFTIDGDGDVLELMKNAGFEKAIYTETEDFCEGVPGMEIWCKNAGVPEYLIDLWGAWGSTWIQVCCYDSITLFEFLRLCAPVTQTLVNLRLNIMLTSLDYHLFKNYKASGDEGLVHLLARWLRQLV